MQSVNCLQPGVKSRTTPCKSFNAQRLHPQRQLISLQTFTTQLRRRQQSRNVTQAAMHGDDWSTAPDSYLTLVRDCADPYVKPQRIIAAHTYAVCRTGTGALLRENRRREAKGPICDRTYHRKLPRMHGSRYITDLESLLQTGYFAGPRTCQYRKTCCSLLGQFFMYQVKYVFLLEGQMPNLDNLASMTC